jgi:signal transduction histidine kinase
MIASLIAVGGFAAGAAAAALILRERALGGNLDEDGLLAEPVAEPAEQPAAAVEPPQTGALHLVSLVGDALRGPVQALRRASCPPDVIARFEHVAWQARMLTSRARPMQAQPASAIALLQEAAEQVEALRLGKVGASWTLLTRTPVYLDPDRARSAFRELLSASAAAAGEGGRLSVRIHEGKDDAFPVRAEIEIGRRRAEPDALAFLVAKHLLESQGARVRVDGRVTAVDLRCIAPESDDATG